jgi:hypothetical protein
VRVVTPGQGSWLDRKVSDEPVDEHESVSKVDDPTREVAFETVAYEPDIPCFSAGVEKRSRVGELRRCSREPITDGVSTLILVAVVEDMSIVCEL